MARHYPHKIRNLFDICHIFQDNARFRSEGFPSGQRGQTVNLLAQPSKVRILPPPPTLAASGCLGSRSCAITVVVRESKWAKEHRSGGRNVALKEQSGKV